MVLSWSRAGVVRRPDIQCLKKGAAAVRPLDHRPIALLNSDYKVFARVVAHRVLPLLDGLFHPLQTGFVPGGSIQTSVDALQVAQPQAKTKVKLRASSYLILDFTKAYDSLDWGYVAAWLRWMALPEKFVRTVMILHHATGSVFLVNGFGSRCVGTTCSIRHRCSLAPLLIIVALHVLYRLADPMAVPGITMPAEGDRGAAHQRVRRRHDVVHPQPGRRAKIRGHAGTIWL